MANRAFNQFQHSLEKGVVHLYAEVTFATGVSTITSGRGKGITSITQSSGGKYDIVLDDKYIRLLSCDAIFKDTSAVPVSMSRYLVAEAVSSGTLSIIFGTTSTTGSTSTAPADTSTLYLHLALSNSSAK